MSFKDTRSQYGHLVSCMTMFCFHITRSDIKPQVKRVVNLVTSLAKEVMFLVALVSLSVCLFVCGQHYSKSYERIGMKLYGRVLSSTRKN